MRKNISASLLISALLASVAFISASGRNSSDNYRLVWEENFDSTDIDSDSWRMMYRRNSDAGRYFSRYPHMYEMVDGCIRLFAKNNDGTESNDTARYLTAGIETFGKKSFRYGKIEVRARMKGATGVWPAIWLRGVDERYSTYPDYAEIDIMERLNHDSYVYQTVHTDYTDNQKPFRKIKSSGTAPFNENDFNVFSVEILPNKIILSVNGRKTLEYRKLANRQGQFPFGCEMHLMLDIQLGGRWVGKINPSELPAYLDIDWVRFYEKQ